MSNQNAIVMAPDKCPICGAKRWFKDPNYSRYDCGCIMAVTVSGKVIQKEVCINTLRVVAELGAEITGLKAYIGETEERGRQVVAMTKEGL